MGTFSNWVAAYLSRFLAPEGEVLMAMDDINSAQKAPPAQQRPTDHAGPTDGRRVTLALRKSSVPQSDQGGRFDPIDHWGKK